MLASVLPGIRDFRTPFVTGVLYLFLLWLWFGDKLVPDMDAASALERRLASLVADYGPSVGLTVLAFCAYIIGSLVTVNSLPVENFTSGPSLGNLRATTAQWASSTASPMPQAVVIPYDQLSPKLLPPITAKQDQSISRAEFYDLCIKSVASDRTSLEMRLAQSAPGRFDDYDRLQTEAALRLSMVLPIVLIVVTFAADFPFAALALVVPATLFVQGVSLLGKARLLLVTALINGLMTSPTRDSVYAAQAKQGPSPDAD